MSIRTRRLLWARDTRGAAALVPRRSVAVLVACIFAMPIFARAQAPDPNEAALTLALSATELPTNGRVTISGLAYPQPGVQVRVTVTLPSGSPSVLVVSPDNGGRYSIMFGMTQNAGDYTVSAQAGAKTTPGGGALHGTDLPDRHR
jgi:hypothetical protein